MNVHIPLNRGWRRLELSREVIGALTSVRQGVAGTAHRVQEPCEHHAVVGARTTDKARK